METSLRTMGRLLRPPPRRSETSPTCSGSPISLSTNERLLQLSQVFICMLQVDATERSTDLSTDVQILFGKSYTFSENMDSKELRRKADALKNRTLDEKNAWAKLGSLDEGRSTAKTRLKHNSRTPSMASLYTCTHCTLASHDLGSGLSSACWNICMR